MADIIVTEQVKLKSTFDPLNPEVFSMLNSLIFHEIIDGFEVNNRHILVKIKDKEVKIRI